MDDFIKPDTPYLNLAEAELFGRLRARGEITFFGCTTCDTCGAEIPKPKLYCSKACYDGYAEACEALAAFFQSLNEEE